MYIILWKNCRYITVIQIHYFIISNTVIHTLCFYVLTQLTLYALYVVVVYTQKKVKLTRYLFLILHGHNVHRQQRQLSNFLMRYQQFASHAYCGAAGPVSKMAS